MKISLSWVPIVFSVELHKVLAYKFDFWVKFLGSIAINLSVAFFLWKAIFSASGQTEIGGYTFETMMLYALFMTFVERMTANIEGASRGLISNEIYDGGLTRYLIYPVPVLGYKYVMFFTHSMVAGLQLLLVTLIVKFSFHGPAIDVLTAPHFLLGFLATLLGGLMYFFLLCLFEMVAFWADNVWSLTLMLRFAVLFAGGGMLPLSTLPPTFQSSLEVSPFAFVFSVPIRLYLGRITASDWLILLPWYFLWLGVAIICVQIVWKRGIRQYSGIGL